MGLVSLSAPLQDEHRRPIVTTPQRHERPVHELTLDPRTSETYLTFDFDQVFAKTSLRHAFKRVNMQQLPTFQALNSDI